MRKVRVERVLSGVKLGKAIFTPDGRILLDQGIELKESYLDKIREFGISEIYVEDEISQDIEVRDVICDKTRTEAKSLIKELFSRHSFTVAFDFEQVKALVERIIDEILANEDLLVNLSDIRLVDDYTFEHSVNVCTLSAIIGVGLGYSHGQLTDLGVGALLHDIGKLKIPDEILKKPYQLTAEEFEEIKKHTVYGYELLKNNGRVSALSSFIAFSHHERFDGSGYPMQLKGDSIHECARIVAVADVYDALTSDRVYRKSLKAHEVFDYITALGSHHFDQKAVDSFIKYIAVYPVGTGVMLSTREKGLVVRVNKSLPTRPVVRVVCGELGNRLESSYELDLSKRLNVFIVDSCEL